MPLLPALFLFLHLASAALWVGGMATLHFAVRPSAVATLEPPLRLTMMSATLGRFFSWVLVAIVLLLVSGFGMVGLSGGFARVHWTIHAMTAIGIVMMLIFGHIRFGVYPKLVKAVAAATWPAAASRLDLIRKMVALNLVLGVVIFVVAALGRAF